MLYPPIDDILNFIEPRSRAKQNRRIHPTLHPLLLIIHKFNLPAHDDYVEIRTVYTVHPFKDVIEQYRSPLLY